MGREFQFTCSEHEREELLQAAAYLDKKMCEISEDGKVVGSERIAIMAGLNIAHEFLTAKVRGGSDMGRIKRKIDHMQVLLDKAVLDQNKLF